MPHRLRLMSSVLSVLRWVFLALLTCVVSCVPRSLPKIVKIGLVAPFEGRYRYIGYDAIYAARLAVREINAAGGIAGWRLELVAYDDRADPEMARVAARNLALDPDVLGVIGHFQQSSTESAAVIYADAGMPSVIVGAWVSETLAPAWQLIPSPQTQAEAMVGVGSDLDVETVVTLGNGCLNTSLAKSLSSRGYTVLDAPVPQVLPDLVLFTADAIYAAEQLLAWREQDWRGRLVGSSTLGDADFGVIAGPYAAGVRFVTPYPLPHDLPDIEAWTADYLAVGPHVPEPGPYALPAYEAVYVFAEALMIATQTEAPSRAALTTSLPKVNRAGILGTITWDVEGFWRDPRLYTYVWEPDGPRLCN